MHRMTMNIHEQLTVILFISKIFMIKVLIKGLELFSKVQKDLTCDYKEPREHREKKF